MKKIKTFFDFNPTSSELTIMIPPNWTKKDYLDKFGNNPDEVNLDIFRLLWYRNQKDEAQIYLDKIVGKPELPY